jgi:Uma2 family endonuclease
MGSAIDHSAVEIESIDTSRYEQIEGRLSERPMPKVKHSRVQGRIVQRLGPKAELLGLIAYPELSIDKENAPDSDWMTPDVVVAPSDLSQSDRQNALPPLLLAIEVLSAEQTIPEMIRKANRYLDWGVRNVWLIEPQKQFALVLSEGDSKRQPILIWPGFDLQLANGLSIPLADLLG